MKQTGKRWHSKGAKDAGRYQAIQPMQDACCLLCLGLHLPVPVFHPDLQQEQPWEGISEQGILLNSTGIGCSAVHLDGGTLKQALNPHPTLGERVK